MNTYDIILIGGGIVGVCTAWKLKQRYPDADILLIEKESSLARHQTGRNSGVIHAGVYYQPGSLKAEFCKRGAAETISFCRMHGLPYNQCGKLLVATDPFEVSRMDKLEERCHQNEIGTQRLTQSELNEMEPNITGLAALYVAATGITDYRSITSKMAELFVQSGGKVKTGCEVIALYEDDKRVRVQVEDGILNAGYLVVCGGLQADRLAKMMHLDLDFQIIPFRGEYYQLPEKYSRIVSHLIYPIPDPELPFLGVHLTMMIDGSVTVGPNAVIGWKREGYGKINVASNDILEMLVYPGFWRVVLKNLKFGLSEIKDSALKPAYLKRIRKYCPYITAADLLPYPVGIRAQAVKKDGSLVHDFLFAESSRSLHVCNAPSPAATSAMPIGEYLCQKVADKFKL